MIDKIYIIYIYKVTEEKQYKKIQTVFKNKII